MEIKLAKGDVVLRISSVCLISGGLITGVANAMHPRGRDRTLENVQPLLEIINRVGIRYWKIDHVMLILGIWLTTIGWLGVFRLLQKTRGGHLASIAFVFKVVATALWTAVFVMDTNVGLVALQWNNAVGETAKATWIAAASAVSSLSFSLDQMNLVVECVSIVAFGVAILKSEILPRWIGWAGCVLGVATAVGAGLPQFFLGPGTVVTNIVFVALASFCLLWMLTIGVWIARRTF